MTNIAYARKGVTAFLPACLAAALMATPAFAKDAGSGAAASEKGHTAAANRADGIKKIYEPGLNNYTDGRYQEAKDAFLSVWKVSPTYDVAANLGLVELKLGNTRAAATYLAFAMKNWPTAITKSRESAERAFAEAEAQVGTLVIRVSVRGAAISIDGKPVGEALAWPEVFVSPGKHRIDATLDGYEPASANVEVGKGKSREVPLALRPVESSGKSVAAIAIGGAVSAAVIGTGLVMYFMGEAKLDKAAESSADVLEGTCVNGGSAANAQRCTALINELKAGDRLINLSAIPFAVGGVGGLMILGYALWPSPSPEKNQGVRVRPLVSGAGGGLGVTGSF
jgi:hypothetical protein